MRCSSCFKAMVIATSLATTRILSGDAFAQCILGPQASVDIAGAQDEVAIKRVMASYNDALNGGKTAAVLPLYAEDGVFMAPYSQSAVGREAVRVAYDAVFDELKFDVKFNIVELVVMAPSWAYVRTNSTGRTVHHSTGKTTAEANQELFIFKKGDDSAWRIARYSFSPTNSPEN
jgi:uncharacterized protein (TIGR02246 family)